MGERMGFSIQEPQEIGLIYGREFKFDPLVEFDFILGLEANTKDGAERDAGYAKRLKTLAGVDRDVPISVASIFIASIIEWRNAFVDGHKKKSSTAAESASSTPASMPPD
ncbi:MAG: hypothetical protein QM811_07055 [Pirellulales bacterium]